MKSPYLFITGLLFTGAMLSCGTDPQTCNLDLPPYVAPNGGFVSYSVTSTGTATIDMLTIYAAAGPVHYADPLAPFTDTLNIDAGDTIRIIVTGTVTGGSLTASYIYTDGVDIEQDSEQCSN